MKYAKITQKSKKFGLATGKHKHNKSAEKSQKNLKKLLKH